MRLEMLSVCLSAGLTWGTPAAAGILHDWDDRRAAAWATGDPGAVGSLYVPGSAVGGREVAALREWRARGLRVEGLRMQVVDLDVRRASATRLDLVVTDRLVGAVAVGHGVRLPLPRDGFTTRRVVLRHASGAWRVAQASPARTTSWTVRSRNE